MNTFSLAKQRLLIVALSTLLVSTIVVAQKHRAPSGGRVAVVVDEKLSVLRDSPTLDGRLIRRISRGQQVAIRGEHRSREGVLFCRVKVTKRTSGWIPRYALITTARGEDVKLLSLIVASEEFDRVARTKIFLDLFPHSAHRPAALLILGDTAEAVSEKLSRDAARRLNEHEFKPTGVPAFAYFLNFNGLDRYNRQGITFAFDRETKRFHYSGAAWREILRRYPNSPEAVEARQRLQKNLPVAAAKPSEP